MTFFYSGVFSLTTAKKMKSSIKDFSSKCDEIRSFLRIWSCLLEKPLMENFIFYAVHLNSLTLKYLMQLIYLDIKFCGILKLLKFLKSLAKSSIKSFLHRSLAITRGTFRTHGISTMEHFS